MKKIGDISYSQTDEDPIDGYSGGIIVQLTRREAITLRKLKESLDGLVWKWDMTPIELGRTISLEEEEMSNVFDIIRLFAMNRFHLNEMKQAVERMDKVLMCLESADDNEDSNE